MSPRLIARLGALPWVRRAVFIGVGLAVFVLGATYLSLRYPPDVETFMVIGSGHVAAGETTAFRVRARLIDGRENVPVRVESVAFVAGVHDAAAVASVPPVPFEVEGDDPATVRFRVPVVHDRRGTLGLTVQAEDRREVLAVPLTVLAAEGDLDATPPPLVPPELPETSRAFRLDVQPEGGGVVARLDNRVFVRVRDPAGAPVGRAVVTVTHAALPDGEVVVRTDANGLGELRLEAERPSYQLAFTVRARGEEAQFEETIAPAGRQILLRGPSGILAPGEQVEVDVLTWKRDSRVYCDLRRGPVWLSSQALDPPRDGKKVTVGPLAPGRYDLQCYFHPHTPGSTWATWPVVVADGSALAALTAQVERTARLHPAQLVFDAAGDAELAAAYLLAQLNTPPVMPEALLNTRADDDAAREAAWASKKRLVLIVLGGVFLLIVLVVFDLILGNIIAQRDRMRAYAAELDDDEAPDDEGLDDLVMAPHKTREGLTKTRGVVLAILVGGTIVANLIAFITLMILIR